jgi:hypothetical protein
MGESDRVHSPLLADDFRRCLQFRRGLESKERQIAGVIEFFGRQRIDG